MHFYVFPFVFVFSERCMLVLPLPADLLFLPTKLRAPPHTQKTLTFWPSVILRHQCISYVNTSYMWTFQNVFVKIIKCIFQIIIQIIFLLITKDAEFFTKCYSLTEIHIICEQFCLEGRAQTWLMNYFQFSSTVVLLEKSPRFRKITQVK